MKYACTTCGAISNNRRCPTHQPNTNTTRNPNRDLASHQRFARAVKKRDGYRCTICGSTHQIVAHHHTPLHAGGTDDPANGTTLCHHHHRQADRYAT